MNDCKCPRCGEVSRIISWKPILWCLACGYKWDVDEVVE